MVPEEKRIAAESDWLTWIWRGIEGVEFSMERNSGESMRIVPRGSEGRCLAAEVVAKAIRG